MKEKKVASELGEIKLTKTYIERDKTSEDGWGRILDTYSEPELVTKLYFRDIDTLRLEDKTFLPHIVFETEAGEKKLFFEKKEVAKECFAAVNHRWRVFKQNYD